MSQLPGVQDIQAEIDARLIEIHYDSEQVGVEVIQIALENIGYDSTVI